MNRRRSNPYSRLNKVGFLWIGLIAIFATLSSYDLALGQQNWQRNLVSESQDKVVKINGGGGPRRLESYQSGLLISEDGYVLTTWSYVLDSQSIIVTMNDGSRFESELVGYDPRVEIAVLKIPIDDAPHYNLDAAANPTPGKRVFVLSNLYQVASGDEPVSVQSGFLTGIAPLNARKRRLKTVFDGEVLWLDAITSNPGARGGVVVDQQGKLLGMVGKELNDPATGDWINYAIPAQRLNSAVQDIRSGKLIAQTDTDSRKPSEPMTLKLLGIRLVADVVRQTPPFVDFVQPGSVADKAGIRTNDLFLMVEGQLTPGTQDVVELLSKIDRDDEMSVTIRRGNEFLDFEIRLNQ